MIKGFKIVLSVLVCLVFIGSMGSASSALAAPPIPPDHQQIIKDNGAMVTATTTDAALKGATMYWSREARQAAKPMGMISVKPSDLNALASYAETGVPGSKPGGMPDPAVLTKAQGESSEAAALMSDRQSMSLPTLSAPSLVPYGTKNIYDGYYANYYDSMWLYYPYATTGRLYFLDPWGYENWCSASLISQNNIIVTAAHCVYNTDQNYWYWNWVFVPADYNYSAPIGAYGADNEIVWAKWMTAKKSSSALNWDVALLHLTGSPSATAGWMGYAWNQSYKSLVHTMGYASNIWNGISSYICVAETFQKKSDVFGMGCSMTYGSSGSPWILDFEPRNSGYVTGVVSSGTPGIPTFYGPRFSTKNFLPLCSYWGC